MKETRDFRSIVSVVLLLESCVWSFISQRTYVVVLMVFFVVTSSTFDHLRKTCFRHVRSSTVCFLFFCFLFFFLTPRTISLLHLAAHHLSPASLTHQEDQASNSSEQGVEQGVGQGVGLAFSLVSQRARGWLAFVCLALPFCTLHPLVVLFCRLQSGRRFCPARTICPTNLCLSPASLTPPIHKYELALPALRTTNISHHPKRDPSLPRYHHHEYYYLTDV
jgi:hypothetical protein